MNPMKRFDLVAFDLDGTLVDDTVFVWETLHDYFDTPVELREMAFHRYMDHQWSYQEWFEFDIQLLRERGADRPSMLRAIQGMKLMEGVEETLLTLQEAGSYLIVISGSLDIVVEKFELDRFFREIYLNRLRFDDGGKLVEWNHTPYDVYDKAVGLRDVASRLGIPMENTAYVGDNFNDIAVARAAGFSVAFNCKSQELSDVADVTVPGGDLRAILPHLLRQ